MNEAGVASQAAPSLRPHWRDPPFFLLGDSSPTPHPAGSGSEPSGKPGWVMGAESHGQQRLPFPEDALSRNLPSPQRGARSARTPFPALLRVTAPEGTRPALMSLFSEQTSVPARRRAIGAAWPRGGCRVPRWWRLQAPSVPQLARPLPWFMAQQGIHALVPERQRVDSWARVLLVRQPPLSSAGNYTPFLSGGSPCGPWVLSRKRQPLRSWEYPCDPILANQSFPLPRD